MKLIIKSNGEIKSAEIEKHNGKVRKIDDIYSIELNFETSYNYSDFEIWLDDDNSKYLDHICLNVSKRNKLQSYK